MTGIENTKTAGMGCTVTLNIDDQGKVNNPRVTDVTSITGTEVSVSMDGDYAEISGLPTGRYRIAENLTPEQVKNGIYLLEQVPLTNGEVILEVKKADIGVVPECADFTNNIGNKV